MTLDQLEKRFDVIRARIRVLDTLPRDTLESARTDILSDIYEIERELNLYLRTASTPAFFVRPFIAEEPEHLRKILDSVVYEYLSEEAIKQRKAEKTARDNWKKYMDSMSEQRRMIMNKRYNQTDRNQSDVGRLDVLKWSPVTLKNAYQLREKWLIRNLEAFSYIELEINDARSDASFWWPNKLSYSEKWEPSDPPRPDFLSIPPVPIKLGRPLCSEKDLKSFEQQRLETFINLRAQYIDHPVMELHRQVWAALQQKYPDGIFGGGLNDEFEQEEMKSRSFDVVRYNLTDEMKTRLDNEWKQQIFLLERRKQIISAALKDMEHNYHEWYLILWNKYVEGRTESEVCSMTLRNGLPLTRKEYRLSRKQALIKFDALAVGLDSLGT